MIEIELTIVIPCLDESLTIGPCVRKAFDFIRRAGITGEVLVADNGSIDDSPAIAKAAGARIATVSAKGYGAALLGGIDAAQGRFIVVGDADDSYDFSNLDAFVAKLREGYDLVMGNRFLGGIAPGAMPPLHRYLGNPVLSFIGRIFFRTKIRDFHCGLRGFRKDSILNLNLTTTGMEFASEMVVKAALAKLQIAEVPTTLSRDGRNRRPHLRTWRDGWRHLRFLLLFSPRWLFLYPGAALLFVGCVVQALLFRGALKFGSIGLDVHTMLYAATMAIVGMQMIWFAIFSRVYGTITGILPRSGKLDIALQHFTLERGLLIGAILVATGIGSSIRTTLSWAVANYSALDPSHTMRMIIPSVTMMIAGMEFILASFFLGILRIERKDSH